MRHDPYLEEITQRLEEVTAAVRATVGDAAANGGALLHPDIEQRSELNDFAHQLTDPADQRAMTAYLLRQAEIAMCLIGRLSARVDQLRDDVAQLQDARPEQPPQHHGGGPAAVAPEPADDLPYGVSAQPTGSPGGAPRRQTLTSQPEDLGRRTVEEATGG